MSSRVVITSHARRWAIKQIVRRSARHLGAGYALREAAADHAECLFIRSGCSAGRAISDGERYMRDRMEKEVRA